MENLTLKLNGLELQGWESIRVTRGIERCPNDFCLSMTERFPGELDFLILPGDACSVWLGADQVVNGYVDRVNLNIAHGQHSVTVSGRGRCSDLVDCSAEWPGAQMVATSALALAQKLAAPYGITAQLLGADPGPTLPTLILNVGETPFDVIERVCRFAALLAYEGTDGNLILSRVGSEKAGSGFAQGVNVESASISYTSDQQYSEYQVVRMAMDTLSDMGGGGNIILTVNNPNITRHRRRVIVAEGGDPGSEIAKTRALWECSRRWGRSAQLRLKTDSWRDSAGALYAPNTLVDLSLPALKASGKTWLISEVSYTRDNRGTACDLVIMPPEAFLPQPILLQRVYADIPNLPR
jgi:prophage tail gpP-like protein